MLKPEGEPKSTTLLETAKEALQGLREDIKDPQRTQIWKSIFRVKHERTDPRTRSLGVLGNVFLHLHPGRINRDAVRYSYTWGMGGITFYLYLVLTFTGVLLMFYYHPTKLQAFRDILYLEHDVPFGKLSRNMHRWAAHLMIITLWLHMFRVVLTGSYRRPREFNWCVGVILLVLTLLLSFRLPAAGRSARLLGGYGRHQHGPRHAAARQRGTVRTGAWDDAIQRRAFRLAGRLDRGCQCAAAGLHLALHCDSGAGLGLHDRALLARAQRRWNLRPVAGDAGVGDQASGQGAVILWIGRRFGKSFRCRTTCPSRCWPSWCRSTPGTGCGRRSQPIG